MIADEPTSALDVIVQARVLETFLELVREVGAAVILVSHDMGAVAETTTHTATMYAGKIVEFGATRDLLTTPKHPYLGALLASLPRLGEQPERLFTIAGQPPQLPGMLWPCAFAPRCGFATQICAEQEPVADPSAEHRCACHHPLDEAARAEVARMSDEPGMVAVLTIPETPPLPAGTTVTPERGERRTGLRIGLIMLGVIAVLSIAAPLVAPKDPSAESVAGLGPDGGPQGPGLPVRRSGPMRRDATSCPVSSTAGRSRSVPRRSRSRSRRSSASRSAWWPPPPAASRATC